MLLSSHLLDRVQSVCDRVALFNAGKIALMGTVAELGRQVLGGGYAVEVEAEGGEGLRQAASAHARRTRRQRDAAPGRFRMTLRPRRAPEAAAAVVAAGGRLKHSRSMSRASRRSTRAISRARRRRPVMRREGSALQGLGVVDARRN